MHVCKGVDWDKEQNVYQPVNGRESCELCITRGRQATTKYVMTDIGRNAFSTINLQDMNALEIRAETQDLSFERVE